MGKGFLPWCRALLTLWRLREFTSSTECPMLSVKVDEAKAADLSSSFYYVSHLSQEAMVSVPDLLSLPFVYRKATDFCALTVYFAYVTKVFISYRCFLVEFLGSFLCSHIIFKILYLFLSCIYLLDLLQLSYPLAKTSTAILNRYGESEPLRLFPNYFREILAVLFV